MPQLPPVQDTHAPVRTQLFTLRVWREDLGGGRSEWRGKVQHTQSGEARYFRDWSGLVACLQEIIANQPADTRGYCGAIEEE
jgi:hypothetical protein